MEFQQIIYKILNAKAMFILLQYMDTHEKSKHGMNNFKTFNL